MYIEPGKTLRKVDNPRGRASQAKAVSAEREEEEEGEQADEDVRRLLKVLQNKQVQEAIRRVLTAAAERSTPFPFLETSPILAKKCVELFQSVGVWTLPGVRVQETLLKESLVHWLSKQDAQACFPVSERENLRTESKRLAVATLILEAFEDPLRLPFPGEGKRNSAVEWAGAGRKLRQITLFKSVAAEDLAFSDWYIERIDAGESEETVWNEAHALDRHINQGAMSEAGWKAFFDQLIKLSPEFVSDEAKELLKSAYEAENGKITFVGLVKKQKGGLTSHPAYAKQLRDLRKSKAVAVDLDLVSEHESEQ